MFSDSRLLLKLWLKNPMKIGTVAPSSPELANAAFDLKNPGDKAGPLDTSTGVELLKLQVKTVAMSRSFEESKEQIRQRMARERRSHDYDEWVKKLRENTKVAIHEPELEKIQVEMPPQTQPVGPANAAGIHPPAQATPPQPVNVPTTTSKIGGN